MRLHHPALVGVERAGLAENPVGDADLADVVQQVAELDGLVREQLGRDDRRQLARVPLHARRVRAGADVARLERVRERTERLAVGPLDVAAVTALDLEQAPHVTGVEQELVVGQRLGGFGEQRRRRGARRALDRGEQIERAERLPHDGGSAGVSAGLLLEIAAGEQHDPDLARLVGRVELARERDAVDAGQPDVEHDHVGPRARDRLERLLGAAGLLDRVPRRARRSCAAARAATDRRRPRGSAGRASASVLRCCLCLRASSAPV